MFKSMFLSAFLIGAAGGAAFAGHANPWAGEDDVVLSQYHEENLAQSEDTPGEDEMLGVMVQKARGKLESVSDGSSRKSGRR